MEEHEDITEGAVVGVVVVVAVAIALAGEENGMMQFNAYYTVAMQKREALFVGWLV